MAWITDKYVEWRGDAIGRERSQKEFARWIGVSPQVLSTWFMGSVPKLPEHILALVDRFGDEVYDVLGIPPYQRAIHDIRIAYEAMTPEQQNAFVEKVNRIIEETLTEYGAKRVKE